MSQNFQTNYQPLGGADTNGAERDSAAVEFEREDDLSPDTHSSMVFHVVPKSSKSRWNHIEDLDSFFKRVYTYHQNNGMFCMMLKQGLELVQYIFVLVFAVFLITSVDYDIMFRNKTPHGFQLNFTDKVYLSDVIRSREDILDHFSVKLVCAIILASIIWLLRLGYICFSFFQFWEIKMFFNNALGMLDKELGNITWEEVQQRLMEVQIEQRMCIHKEVLTELDIYHRILRFTNYFIAMVNKNIIPLKYEVPFVGGEIVLLTKGLRMNIDMLLFWGPLSPFKSNWHLDDEYKRAENRQKLAEELSKRILIIGIGNLILSPLVFTFQVMCVCFYYAEIIKREPGAVGSRCWSNYGAVYLRHFNELDHELKARLCRGYKAASQYMNIFSSPVMAILARHCSFMLGVLVSVLALLTFWDEDVILVDHMLTIGTVLTVGFASCALFIPDDNLVFCPELLMRRVLGEVHYIPDNWREKAHTSKVRQEFSQLFQYKLTWMLEEVLSPILTPLIFIFRLRYKTLEIVDFFRNFTVEVVGVGDVCSFAQMDVRQHGSPTWQPDVLLEDLEVPEYNHKQDAQTDGGKTELSLLHFTMTNPRWKPPQQSSAFITALKTQAQRDMTALTTVREENALLSSLNSISCGGGGLGIGGGSMFSPWVKGPGYQPSMLFQQSSWNPRNLRGGSMSRLEGSRLVPSGGILSSITQHQMRESSVECPIEDSNITSGPIIDPVLVPSSMWNESGTAAVMPTDLTAVDMTLSTMYLHEIHHRHRHRATYTDAPVPPSRPLTIPPSGAFQNVSFMGQSSNMQPEGSSTPTVAFQRAHEHTPLLSEP